MVTGEYKGLGLPVHKMENGIWEQEVQRHLDRVASLLERKCKAYGRENIRVQGLFGVISRMALDKSHRAMNLAKAKFVVDQLVERGLPKSEARRIVKPPPTGDESLKDTIEDIIGYCIISLMLIEGTWDYPFMEDTHAPTD